MKFYTVLQIRFFFSFLKPISIYSKSSQACINNAPSLYTVVYSYEYLSKLNFFPIRNRTKYIIYPENTVITVSKKIFRAW